MSVRVDLNPILRRQYRPDYDPHKGLILDDAVGKTLTQIVQELGIPLDEVTSTLVNHYAKQSDYRIQDGDRILLTIAISGG